MQGTSISPSGRTGRLRERRFKIGLLRGSGVRTLLFCYDLIPYLFPNLYGEHEATTFADYLRGLLAAADSVLWISRNTEKDLHAFIQKHGGPYPRMGILPLGSDNDLPAARAVPGVEGEFILFVSSLDRRKNHEILYKAYVTMREKHSFAPPLCVFVGMPGPTVSELLNDITLDPRVQNDFLILASAGDGEVRWLYENCLFTVFPSLYEGWGLPIAESLLHGKLVLAADTSSLREVGGDLIEYIDPWNSEAWSD